LISFSFLQGSPAKAISASNVPSSPPDVSQPEKELPPPGVGNQEPHPDSMPHISTYDSLPNPPTSAPGSQGFHHTRHVSSDDIDLPAAPTQPIYPGVQHSSQGYQHGFSDPYAPTHYGTTPGTQDTGAPPPVIHDWSGGHAHESAGPPYSAPLNYSTAPHDHYSSNAPSYSSIPPSPPHSPYVNPTDQGFDYSQYPSAPGSGYQGNTYPSVPPTQNYSTGYTEPPHHYRTTSAPVASSPVSQVSGYSNGIYPSDSNYQPPPDKIAEAHKAARFAVSSLAFDDVQTALEFLRKSLELLTVPSQAT
jgi:vacuolar protein sorting-associated protein VTA1